MQRLLIGALLALLFSQQAFADSTVHGLATNTTSPLPASSCIYVDQGGTTDTKLCSGWAAALGGLVAANNLSDLVSASTARTNLGLTSLATTSPGTGEASAIAAAINSSTGLIGALTPTLNNCVVGNGSAWTSTSCPGGGLTIGGSNGQIQYNNAGALGGVTLTAGTPNISLSGTANSTISTTNPQNAPADGGTHSYTILSSDLTKEVDLVSTFTAAVVPQATGSFGAGTGFKLCNAGAITATSTTSTINGIAGATGLKLGATGCSTWTSDGTNWKVDVGVPTPASQAGTTCLNDSGGYTSCSGGSFTSTWTSYTPTLSCNSGTLTTSSSSGHYVVNGKVTMINVTVTITSAGTCSYVKFSLPNTPNFAAALNCKENAATGRSGNAEVVAATTTAVIDDYLGSNNSATSGWTWVCSGVYENQ